MVAINFKVQFADDILSGKKRQTIRAETKAVTGCELKMYLKDGRKYFFLNKAICVSVQKVTLMASGVQQQGSTFVAGYQAEAFAQADGFKTYADMWAFFKNSANKHGEFIGYLVKW